MEGGKCDQLDFRIGRTKEPSNTNAMEGAHNCTPPMGLAIGIASCGLQYSGSVITLRIQYGQQIQYNK